MNLLEALRIFVLAEKCENDNPEHIERSQSRNQASHNRYEVMTRQFSIRKRARENRVLAQESGGERHTAYRERVHEECTERDGHLLLKPSHIPDVLRIGVVIVRVVKSMMHSVN